MGKPITLLEGLCRHALSFGLKSFETECADGHQRAFAQIDGIRTRIANFKNSSRDAREFLANLRGAAVKPVRTVIDGKVYILRVHGMENQGEAAFEVRIEAAPKLDPSVAPVFTAKQGQYLAFIHNYTLIHQCPPAETDLQRYFRVSPPSIHEMVKTLERNGLIEKIPGKARSMRLTIGPQFVPPLRRT